jgi:transketolase
MRTAFFRTLAAAAERDPRVVLITGDLGFGVVTEFAARRPRQFINAGVAEQNMTAIACGLALEGRKVFTYSIANFATLRCLEQLRNDVCYHEADVTVVAMGGGFSYGQLGMSHFATEDLAILRALPYMQVFAPCGASEAAQVAEALIAGAGPAYLRLDKDAVPEEKLSDRPFRFGRARLLRDGRDVTLISTGGIVKETLLAAEQLSASGVQARVLAIHSVKPLDVDALADAARTTGGLVTIEEHTIIGGLGSAVAEAVTDSGAFPSSLVRMGLPGSVPTVVGDQAYLRQVHRLDATSIATRTLRALSGVTIDV